jgi:hypothetical protein
MAAFNALSILTSLFSIYICYSYAQLFNPIPLEDVSSCTTVGTVRQYYDVTTLSCKDCSQDETFQVTSSDGESRHVFEL